MKTLRTSLLIALTVLGMSAARAQESAPAAAPHSGPERAQMRAKMGEMHAKHQARLHDLLKLTAQQEAAWSTYQAAIKPVAGEHRRPDRAAIAKMTAPERLSQMLEQSKQRQAHLEAHLAALTSFYGQLSAEQKTVFDTHTLGGGHAGQHQWRGARGAQHPHG